MLDDLMMKMQTITVKTKNYTTFFRKISEITFSVNNYGIYSAWQNQVCVSVINEFYFEDCQLI